MTDVFLTGLAFVLHHEGGYSNHPNDPGGRTMRGITQRVYDGYRRRLGLSLQHVRDISDDEVEAIYRRSYWIDGQGDMIAATHPLTAMVHLDACVNTGLGQAAKFLQRAVDAKDDGVIGPRTMAALSAVSDAVVAELMISEREMFYRELAQRRPTMQVFLRGWLNRTAALRRTLHERMHGRAA